MRLIFPFFLLYSTSALSSEIEFKKACICQDGRSLSGTLCEKFCSDKSTYGGEFLFAEFSTNNVNEWCTKQMSDAKAFCVVEAFDNEGYTTLLPVLSYLNQKTLLIDAGAMEYKREYRMQLKEFSSGRTSSSIILNKHL